MGAQLQPVVIVPQTEWLAVLHRLDQLEAHAQPLKPGPTAAPADTVLTSREAAAYLGMKSALSVTKARRAGRLTGVKINEKEWGFRRSELDRYLTRYQRPRP